MTLKRWLPTCLVLLFAAAALADEPTAEQIQWLRDRATPFATVVPGRGLDDLAGLKELVGDARIVSLGESTHGSREIFQMKHRLLEYLATEMGFAIFSIEASMPESYRVNDFVLQGEGDPQDLISGMHFWTWDTQEVLSMVEWMRRFNREQKRRLEFTGYDMQTPDLAMAEVLKFLAGAAPDAADAAKADYARIALARRESAERAAVAVGTFPLDAARGKRVTYSGWIKTEDVNDGFAALWWRADGPRGQVLAFDNMAQTAPRGASDWKHYSFELDVPRETVNINFGLLMLGRGKAWFDGIEVKLDGEVYKNPALDLDFESSDMKGLMLTTPQNYQAVIDRETKMAGKQSLRLSYRKEKIGQEPADGIAVSAAEGHRLAEGVLERLEQSREDLLQKQDAKEVEWAIQNARLVAQCMEMRAGGAGLVRDRCMAENVAWIQKQNPDAKIVLWAHNYHVAKNEGAMGWHLERKFGDDYVAIGFATARGTYQAIAQGRGLSEHKLAEPPAGSIEHAFQKSGLPRFILDLRQVKKNQPACRWLDESRLFRGVGALATDQQFTPQNLTQLFDAVIYIDETSRARPIQR